MFWWGMGNHKEIMKLPEIEGSNFSNNFNCRTDKHKDIHPYLYLRIILLTLFA